MVRNRTAPEPAARPGSDSTAAPAARMKILRHDATTLTVQWGRPSRFHAIWLRDNCRCAVCGDPAIGRRALRLTALDLAVRFERVEPVAVDGADGIAVTWSDGHHGRFDGRWLQDHAYDAAARRRRAYTPPLWDDDFRRTPTAARYADVVDDDAALLDLLHTVKQHGLAFLEGAPARAGTLETLALRIGCPQESNFGRIQDIVADRARRSIANDVDALKPHTDEPYRASPPGILMFHCIEAGTQGEGASIFLDGFEAAETLRADDPDGFAALTRCRQAFRRHFADDVDLIAEFPCISVDEFANLCGVRVNDRVAAPACIDYAATAVYYRGMKRFLELVEDDARILRKVLKPGDMAVFDNHRILHGRTRLRLQGRRRLQWAQVERGDFHSKLRILADRLGVPRDARPLLRGAY